MGTKSGLFLVLVLAGAVIFVFSAFLQSDERRQQAIMVGSLVEMLAFVIGP